MRHLLSFMKSPLGYAFNLLATISCYVRVPALVTLWICRGCECFCINDGIQDDMLF